MKGSLSLTLALMATLATPSFAGIAEVTADGTWDCNGLDGAPMGGVIVAERTYAWFGLDGLVAGYGKLYLLDPENTNLPHFVILDGDLKAVVGAQALSLTGSPDHPENNEGELFLMIVFNETDHSYCRRRVEPAG